MSSASQKRYKAGLMPFPLHLVYFISDWITNQILLTKLQHRSLTHNYTVWIVAMRREASLRRMLAFLVLCVLKKPRKLMEYVWQKLHASYRTCFVLLFVSHFYNWCLGGWGGTGIHEEQKLKHPHVFVYVRLNANWGLKSDEAVASLRLWVDTDLQPTHCQDPTCCHRHYINMKTCNDSEFC